MVDHGKRQERSAAATARCPLTFSPLGTATHCNASAHSTAVSPRDSSSTSCHGRTDTEGRTRAARNLAHDEQKAQSPSKITCSETSTTTRTLPSGWVTWRAVLRIITSPRMIALHVLTIVLVATMLSLANWQWTRHNDRQQFNNEVRARATEPVQPLERVLAAHPEPDDAQWFTVTATGTYGKPTFQLVNVSQNGAAGYDVVTPLTLDDGRVIVINRGFLPLAEPLPSDLAGENVTVIGRVRVSDTKQFGEIDNSAQADLIEIQRIDLQILDDVIEGDVVEVSLDALETTPSDDPRLAPVAEPTLSSGPHLSYTVQWILFSICAIAAWALLVRRAIHQKDSSAQPE